ncbi:flagellar biosynthesis protein FlgB [Stakelama tenebrarum]|uniref:Flagellar biosynthesis protein FlgB n=1 Tax=Stakelama tenebrarum TaxID=2711215 RepID=A0A6G6Y521_9SPHN|nr:flagellar biosynthesis protein FlgB [Sphingosinithalassobacter tenebrarum]QIG79693.1 flagellar biosynthesis protein FlgB [Sphingosinithalassobacter tenebrarum]
MGNTPALLTGIKNNMHYLAERQRVVAENIAHGETPGYKSRDVARPSFGALVDGGPGTVATPQVQLTQGMRSLGAVLPAGAGNVILDTDIVETKPDGNNVTVEDQLMKMGEIQADFTAMASLYRKQLGLLRSAIGKSGG